MNGSKSCDFCLNYEFDEELGLCVCTVNLDMDEAERFSLGTLDCPYFRINNEYKIVEKQN